MAQMRLVSGMHPDLTEIDMRMMKRAIALAREAAAIDEVPVGAVVYRGNEIIAEAANNREITRDPAGHAELIAVSEAGKALGDWRLTGCTVAITLEPCCMCAGAMVNARVDRVIYGASDPKAGGVESLYRILNDKRLNHQVDVYSGLLAEECSEVLKAFFKRRRAENKARRLALKSATASCNCANAACA